MILKPLFEGRKVHSSALNALKACLKKKIHLCPVRLLVCVSSVTPAVENEVDSSSVPIFPSRADDLSGCCPSLSASDKRKKLSQSAPLRSVRVCVRVLECHAYPRRTVSE